MAEVKRYQGLKKFPDLPATQILARAKQKLATPVEAGPAARVPAVLAELVAKGAMLDALKLVAHALPPREATWWACLAARDLFPADEKALPAPLLAAEAWVFKPGEETRAKARQAMEQAGMDDDTTLCAMAAVFAEGTLGTGHLADYAAPPGAVGNAVHGMVLLSHGADPERMEAQGALLLERGLDIARGGSGRLPGAPEAGAAAGQRA